MRSEPRDDADRIDGRSRPVVIELLGTPGAGKTTVAEILVELLVGRGRDAATIVSAGRSNVARSRAGRVADRAPQRFRSVLSWKLFTMMAAVHAARFVNEHRALAAAVVRRQVRRPIPVALRGHIVTNFLRLCGRHRYVTAVTTPGRVVVIDDGFAHRSVHLHASAFEEVDPARVVAYIDRVPAPDVLVVVGASRATCRRRVVERGIWRHSRRLTSVQLARYLVNAEVVVTAAAQRAHELGWQVVHIDNDGRDLEDVRGALAEVIAASAGWRTRLVVATTGCGATA